MASFNRVTLIGHLGSDPDVRYLDGGNVVAQFNVATTEKYTKNNGEKVEQTEWFRVELWNDQAKVAEKYLKKGNPVHIEGRLRSETWVDKEGKERFSLRVRATNMTLLTSGERDGNDGGGYEAPARQQAPATAPTQQAPASADRPQQRQAAPAPAAQQPAPAAKQQPARREPEPTPFEGNSGDDDLPF